jgi:predicted nucleic acid-binding protein
LIVGLDTTFLVQIEIKESREHAAAWAWLRKTVDQGHRLALAPQILTEFVHVVTDSARFKDPLTMDQALKRAESWWLGAEVVHAHADERAVRLFGLWMKKHQLGRKRLLDTMLAATYYAHDVVDIVTTNVRDYSTFGVFRIHQP